MKQIYTIALTILCFSAGFSQTYTDVAIPMGINFSCGGDYGAGVTFCDLNDDGYDDILVCSGVGNLATGIYRNNNGSSFTHIDVPALNGIINPVSAICADYDNNGTMDIFITSFGGRCRLLKNNGNFNFTDVTSQAGIITDSTHHTAACWGDYDNDGWLDLYVGVYRGYGDTNYTRPNLLFHNERNGTFTNRTVAAGVQNLTTQVFALAFFDYNNDGLQDIYVASDRRRGNTLYKNNGDGTFTDVSLVTNTHIVANSMGIAIGDYDNNGYFDLYVCNSEEGNSLLKNNGDGTFTNVSQSLNITVNCVCWGNQFFDYNNDGYLDLFVTTEYGVPNNKDILFKNNGNGTFSRITNIGMDGASIGFGCATGDFNNDGYPDIFVVNYGDPCNLYRSSGGTNKWLKVKLVGNVSNRNGIGSVIEVYRGASKYIRCLNAGSSYISENSLTQMLGLGQASMADSLIVKWPSGWRTRLDNVSANQTITIDENAPIGIIHNGNNIPSSFNLIQNYPNPFNPSTQIQYSVPNTEIVKLDVFDILGNKIAELVNERKSAGTYEVEFNANNFASGIYFYKMTAGKFTQTNKMILVK